MPENARPGYPGEMHARSLNLRHIGMKYNYAGPFTHYEEREARGDRGINDLDEAARAHDKAYFLAGKAYDKDKDKGKFVGAVATADKVFRDKASRSKDDPLLGSIASKAIGAKQVAEVAGLPTTVFSGRGADDPLPGEKLKKMLKKHDKKAAQSGGVLPLVPLAVGVLSSLAVEGVTRLFDHFFGKKGNGKKGKGLSVEEMREKLISGVKKDKVMAQSVLSHVAS